MRRLRGLLCPMHLWGLVFVFICLLASSTTGISSDPRVAWYYDTQELVFCSPAVGDLDSLEPGSEVVIGNRDDGVYCLTGDGRLLWSFRTGQRFFHPAIANIDGQGSPEVLVYGAGGPDSGHVYCLNSDGSERWSFYTGHQYYYPAGLTIANLDTVGEPEIMVGCGSDSLDSLYCLNSDGSLRWSFPTLSHVASPAVANIDEEGTPEVVFACQGIEVYCLDSDGAIIWTRSLQVSWAALTSIADVDLDGEAEIVISGSTIDGPSMLYCFEGDGTLRWTAEVLATGSAQISMAAIDDLNNDAYPEIVVFSNCFDDTRDSLYAFRDEGTSARVVWTAKADDWMGASATAPVICDLNGDGEKEVVWEGTEYLRIYGGSDGRVIYENPDFHCATTQEHPAIADVDGDGRAEIVAPYKDTGVAVLRCDDWTWCRNQFSSYTYHITNINDNLTIPRIEPNHWETHNSWLAQASAQMHDVGVVSIDSPPDTVYVGSSHPVLVRVANFGNYSETFDVEYSLAYGGTPVWVDTVPVISLVARDTVQLSFGDFICSDTTTWQLSFKTLLLGDWNPANDTMSKCVLQVHAPGVGEQAPDCLPSANLSITSSPNPFTHTTVIRYQASADGRPRTAYSLSTCQRINLSIYDVCGKVVRNLVNSSGEAGSRTVWWDARDSSGRKVSAGIYFCRLSAGKFSQTNKLVLLR